MSRERLINDSNSKYSYNQLEKNKKGYIDELNTKYDKKKALWNSNTCDCNKHVYECYRTKPHSSKKECIEDLRRHITDAYNNGDNYVQLWEENYDDPHFSTDTINTVMNEFKYNGLSDMWWCRCYFVRRTFIFLRDYSVFHKGYFYLTGFPLVFDL